MDSLKISRAQVFQGDKLRSAAVVLFASIVMAGTSLFAGTAWATTAWQVREVSGNVQRQDETHREWVAVQSGDSLELPFSIKTGLGASAELVRRGDTVTLNAESTLFFPVETRADKGVLSRIVEKLGFALFRIEPGQARTVTVETPYLVSVVKGTTFSVHATENRAVVNLISGQLEVRATTLDDQVNLSSGEIALIAAGSKKITVIKPSLPAENDAGGGEASLGPVDVVVGTVAASLDVLTPRNVDLVQTPVAPPSGSPDMPDAPDVPDVPDVPEEPVDECSTGGKSCDRGKGLNK